MLKSPVTTAIFQCKVVENSLMNFLYSHYMILGGSVYVANSNSL